MKCQIKDLEEERSKLQEQNSRLQKQLQTAQACRYPIFCVDFALSIIITEKFFHQVLQKTILNWLQQLKLLWIWSMKEGRQIVPW